MLREANGFLAGAAWNGLGVMSVVRWRPGGTGGPPSLYARWWAISCACWRAVPLHIGRCAGLFFPTRGKEPKGDRWQPNRDSTMAAPGPLAAWLEGRNLLLCEAKTFLAGAAWGVMSVVRWRPGSTGGLPSLYARWWAISCACWCMVPLHIG